MNSIYEYFDWGNQDHWAFWLIAGLVILLAVIVVGLIICGIYSLCDLIGSTWVDANGVVIQHQYQAATSSTGYGIGMGSNGAIPMMTSSSSSEEYILFVREMIGSKEGEVYKFDMEMNDYFNHKDGMKVSFRKRIGRISHDVIGKELL